VDKDEALKPEQEFFVVKHYSADERPTIKGNGFDGLEVGTDREDAEEFIAWVNARISTPPQRKPDQEPVAWMRKNEDCSDCIVWEQTEEHTIPLYTTPPQPKQEAKLPVIYCDPNDLQGFIFGGYETIAVGKKSETRTFALYSEAPEMARNRLLIEPAMLKKLGYVPKEK
jgi:hypothetical protein